MKRPSRSKKRYKNDDDRPYFKRREEVEVTQDFIENIGDPDFPRYGWIVKKSRPLMSDPGYEYLIVRDPEFAADDGYDGSYWVNNDEIKRGRYNEGTYWPTPENERIPIYTLELSRVNDDDDDEYVETPMKYSGTYYSDDEAFEAAEQLAAEYADEDGKFEVTIMAGEYQIGDDGDIYGDPYVQDSIQTGRGWKMVKEGFMSNIGKDGQRLYSIIYRTDGWDGSVQEYGKSEEDAIQAAIAKGKLDGDEDIVKIVDLGEKGEQLESSRKLVKEGAGYTEENLIGRKITTSYGADRDPHNARPATIVDAHRRRVSTGMVFDLTVELDDTGETIEQTFNPLSVGDKYTWGPWFRDGEERQYNPYEREYSESKKLVKEGAGAAYTVTIKNAKLDNVRVEKVGDGDWEFEADIVKDTYMVEAADYYNLFCPMDSEFGGEEWVEVAGKVRGVCWWYDDEMDVERQIRGVKQDISFMYGHGWVHANLPEDGHIVSDHMECDGHDTWEIQSIELNAPQLAECVNYCHEHFLDEDEPEEDEDGEQVNEVSGWDLDDEDLTLVNSESDGDKLYIVKLWWGSGYQLDCYNAYAFSDEEALNYVVAYIEKHDPELLATTDERANELAGELEQEHASRTGMGYDDDFYPEDTPEFQETFLWVDATTEGAKKAHYIYAENLAIAEYPKDHDYPMSKGARRMNESYDPQGDDGRKRVMNALEEFRQVLWDDTKVDDEDEHDLRRSLYQDVDNAISQAIQKYFKYSRM